MQTDAAQQMVEAAIAAEEECKGVGITEPHLETTHLGMTRGGSAAAPPPVIPRSLRAIDQGDLVIMTESIPPLAQTWFKRQPPHEDVPCTEVTVTIRRKAPFTGPCHRRVLEPPATPRASTLMSATFTIVREDGPSTEVIIIKGLAAQSSSCPQRAKSTLPRGALATALPPLAQA